MEWLDTISAHPWLWLGIFLVSQVVVFAAREPLKKAFTNIARALGRSLRMAGVWGRGVAATLRDRDSELLLEEGKAEVERKLERDFVRLSDGFAKALKGYPAVHQKLDAAVTELAKDLDESAHAPPEAPGWADAVNAVKSLPADLEGGRARVLGEIQKVAEEGQKRALKSHREAVAKRHKILSGLAPHLKTIQGCMGQTRSSVERALETTAKVDAHMERFEKLRAADESALRATASDKLTQFVVSALVMAIALGGAFVNFQLIALPMSELVPAGSRIGGLPVAAVAALVIVLMEAAAGIFLLDSLAVTELFPRIGSLPTARRRLVAAVSFAGLFILACIEASLAVLREQIVASDLALKQSLSGVEVAAAEPALSAIPVVGQAVLGFVLPWLLALIAVPLETLISSGRSVITRAVAAGIHGAGNAARVTGRLIDGSGAALANLVDVYAAVPILIAGRVSAAPSPAPKRIGRANPRADLTPAHLAK